MPAGMRGEDFVVGRGAGTRDVRYTGWLTLDRGRTLEVELLALR